MENIFSLLFLKHTNLSDDSVMCVDDDGNNSGLGSFPIDCRVSGSVSDTWSDFKSLDDYDSLRQGEFASKVNAEDRVGRCPKEPIHLKEVPGKSDGVRENSHLQILASTTSDFSSGSSICDFSKCGYLINSLVVWDLLLVLHEVLSNSLEGDGSKLYCHDSLLCGVKCSYLLERQQSLLRKVNEGICRLQILSDKFREIGSIVEIEEFMTGNLFYNKINDVLYENIQSSREIIKVKTIPAPKNKSKREMKTFDKSKLSVVNLLLCTPKDLVISTLKKSQLEEAKEIINTHELFNTTEDQELQVVIRCEELFIKFENNLQIIQSIDGDENYSVDEIAINSKRLYNEAIQLQNLANPASSGDASISGIGSTKILIDLALTNSIPFNFSRKLINYTINADRSFTILDKYSNLEFERNLNTYWKQIKGLIMVAEKFQICGELSSEESQFDANVNFSIKSTLSLQDVLLSEINIDTDLENTELLNKVASSLCSISKICLDHQKEELHSNNSGVLCEELNIMYRSLIKTVQEASAILVPKNKRVFMQKEEAHMWSFLSYLKLLNYTCSKFSGTSKQLSSLHLNIIKQKPMSFLSDILFRHDVDPHQLEPLCAKMQIDLLSVISQATCQTLVFTGFCSKETTPYQLSSFGCIQFDGNFILNGGEMTCERSIHGEISGRDILTALLDAVKETLNVEKMCKKFCAITHKTGGILAANKEIKEILKSTAELGSVDLTKLASREESIIFYINLANLMILHAGILNYLIFESDSEKCGLFAESVVERTTSLSIIGYVVGQLGFISLYDILHRIICLPIGGSSLDKIIHQGYFLERAYIPSCFPAFTIFLVSQALHFSPKISVYFSDSFSTDANTAICSYFDQLVNPEWAKSPKDRVFVTNEILNFLKRETWSSQISSLFNLVSSDYFEYLQCLREMTEDGVIECINLSSRIFIDFHEDSFYEEESHIDNIIQAPSLKLVNLKDAPSSIENYVRENNLLLLVLMQTLYSQDKPNMDSISKKICSFKSRKFELDYLSHLLYLPRISNICNIFNTNIGNSVVQFIPDIKLCFEKLEIILNCKQETETVPKNLPIEGVKLIKALPSLSILKYPQLEYVKNLLSVEVLNAESNCESNNNWNYVYEISNSHLMFESGRKNYKKWPIKPLCHWLSFLLSNSNLKQEDHDWADKKIKKVKCYQKICECNILDASCWQDVSKLSDDEPLEMIRRLLKNRNYTLVIEWSHIHELTNRILFYVNQSKLNLYLNGDTPNFSAVNELLLTLETNMLVCTVGALLFQQQDATCRKFIIEKLLERITPGAETDVEGYEFDLFSLRQEVMALILIEDVAPAADRAQLSSMSTKPYVIMEQWIMNLKLSLVEKGLSVISSHLNEVECLGINCSNDIVDDCLCWQHFNLLVENYAQKSLEIGDIILPLSDARVVGKTDKFSLPAKPPLREDWQQDDSSNTCSSCQTVVFSLFNRRHHCRRCGRLICYACSGQRDLVAGYGEVPVRICNDCNEALVKSISMKELNESGGAQINNRYDNSWYLSVYSNHNSCVRRDFSYEYVPSVNICQTLLNLHRNELNAAICVLTLTTDVMKSITDKKLLSHPSTDSTFVFNMLHTLLSYGKVRFNNVGNYRGIAACEYYLLWIPILIMVEKHNVVSLLPLKCLENMLAIGALFTDELQGIRRRTEINIRLEKERTFMRKLRDNLVSRELWDLALNVATKTGQETVGIWRAWGMTSLKIGNFAKARHCFSIVLKPAGNKIANRNTSLLNEILVFLQSKPFNPAYISEVSNFPEESSAKVVLGALDGLSNIIAGKLSQSQIQPPDRLYDARLSPCFKTECEYYLNLYGCHRLQVRFLTAQRNFKACIKYIHMHDVRPVIFAEEVLMTSLKLGDLTVLLDSMRGLNEVAWHERIILFSCHWLEVNKHFNCLLQMQKALDDQLRAGISLIKMYVEEADSFATLYSRKHYMLEAEALLQKYVEKHSQTKVLPSGSKKAEVILNLPIWNVHRQMRLIKSQIKVAGFFAEIERSGKSVSTVIISIRRAIGILCSRIEGGRKSKLASFVPTVFQTQERIVLAIAVTIFSTDIQEAFEFCYDLVEMNSITAQDLLKFIPGTLIILQKEKLCINMIKGIFEWGLISSSEIKDLLMPSLIQAAKLDDQQSYEQLMKFIPTMDTKVDLYIEMGRLKSAYVAIVQQNSMENMVNLHLIALRKNNVLVSNLCTKWIKCRQKIREKSQTDSKVATKSVKGVKFTERPRKRVN